jgi:hypothetical protein
MFGFMFGINITLASRDASMPDVIVFDVIQTLFYCVALL